MNRSLGQLHRLFPESDYRMSMNLRPLVAKDFFEACEGDRILQERRELLREAPQHYLAALPATDLRLWARLAGKNPDVTLLELGAALEPDVVLLHPDSAGSCRVVAGAVCFPTMWSLPEKLGLPLAAVHAPVPGLNEQLSPRIDQFLARLQPGVAYGRENWGLSASAQLDQHPRHRLPALTNNASLESAWLRVEEQALLALDAETILFAIRIVNYRLDEIAKDRTLSERVALALETLSEDLSAYKRLSACRYSIATKLREG